MERWIRPPVELWAALALGCSAIVVWIAPGAFWMSSWFGNLAAAALFACSIFRGVQGMRVRRRVRYIRRIPKFELSFSQLPVSNGRLFLGRGFEWTDVHAQRLHESRSSTARRILDAAGPGRMTGIFLDLLLRHPWTTRSSTMASRLQHATGCSKDFYVGGIAELHGVEPHERNVYCDLRDRVGHTLVLGTTRVGKTRLAEMLIAQDIRRGDAVIVIDPKGDIELLRRMYVETARARRENDFLFFHLGYPKMSARYNAIGRFSRITEVATRIANQLPTGGSSTAFKEFAWRFVNIIARALVALNRVPNYQHIRKYINDIESLFLEYGRSVLARHGPPGWKSLLAQRVKEARDRRPPSGMKDRAPEAVALMRMLMELRINDPVLEGLISAIKYDRTYFDKIVSSVGPLMEKLTTGPVAELISPAAHDVCDPRPTFDWRDVVKNRKVVYVGLDALSEATVASAVGNSMFSDLASLAGYMYKHGIEGEAGDFPPSQRSSICLHADEFNELIGDEFVPLLNKAGGAGFQVTAYTQTWSDVEARLGSKPKTGQVAGNFNTLICLRVKELRTAEMLTRQLPAVSLRSVSQSSAASERVSLGSDVSFDSQTADKVTSKEAPLVAPADLMALPKGQAFALLDGGRLWKLRIPLAKLEPDAADQAWPWQHPPQTDSKHEEISRTSKGTEEPRPRRKLARPPRSAPRRVK